MNKKIGLSIITVVCFMIAAIIIVLPNYTKGNREINEFSYINIWNEDTHYWGYGIVIEDGILCDKLNIYFDEPLVEDISTHIYYSKGEGLSEDESLWTTLKQGKMSECIDLPNGEYKELRLDMAGSFSIRKIMIEQYDRYRNAYYFIAMMLLSVAFICGISLVLTFDRLKLWICNNFKAISICVISGFVVASYSINVWYEIEDMTISSYHLEAKYDTLELRGADNRYSFNIDVHDSKLVWFEFYADILEGNGEIVWNLTSNQNSIATGQLSADNYIEGSKYKIGLDVGVIEDVGMYQLELAPLNTTAIRIYADENNYLKATYYYLFQYGMLLKYLLIIMDILIMLVVIFLLSKLSVYVKYWIMAISLGILSVIIVIPYSTADEFRHFARAYSVANGQFVCQYNEQDEPYAYIPENLYNLRYAAQNNSIDFSDETNVSVNLSRWMYYLKCDDTDEKISAWMGGTDTKGIFEYLPQVIAMWVGMVLGVKQVWLFYLARIGNWATITMLWYAVIKITPKYKFLFLVLYCMPTNIVYACTSSTDGILNALVMLIMSIAVKCYCDNIGFNKKILISITLITTYISIIKLPYILVVFSLIALNVNTKDIRKNYKIIMKNMAIVIGVCVVSYLFSYFLSRLYRPVGMASINNGNIEHIKYASEHLMEVAHMFVQAFMGIVDENYRQAIFINSFYISVLVLPYSVLMLYSGTIEENDKIINSIQTAIMVFICLLMWGSILVAAYFWTDIGYSYLWGIQGRYICSIIMIGAVTLALKSQNHDRISEGRYIPAYCLIIMAVAYLKIIQMQWV